MTYCLAISVDDGLVFASDSRTNAGVDYVATYSKMSRFVFDDNRVLVLLTSGSLATSQAVVNAIKRDLDDPESEFDISQGKYLHEVAQYIGKLSQHEQQIHGEAFEKSNSSNESSFILGGQIKGQPCEIYLIYPQGNFISASAETPYLQIGESKYGKPILDRSVSYNTDVRHAARALMLSFDSTIHSNLSVGMPIDFVLYKNDSLILPKGRRIDERDEYFNTIRHKWSDALRRTLVELPKCPDGYWG